jgi:MFS family permease
MQRIVRFVTARALNSFGRSVINATVGWEIYERTSSTVAIAMIGMVQVLPVVILFIPAGSLVDRSDRRFLTTIAAMLTGGVGIGLAVASATGAPVLFYYACLFVQGCCNAIYAPSTSSLLPLIIERGELERTNRISASASELAIIIGPAVAGAALLVLQYWSIYAFVAVTGIASGTLFRTLPKPRAVVQTEGAVARKDWRVGLRFIWNSPLLLPALTLDMFAVLFAGVTALLPVVAKEILHTNTFGFGILRASQSVGAVLMAVIGSRVPAWRQPGRVLLIVVALFSAATMGFGLSRWFPLSVILLVACGALDNISVVIRLTLEQMVVPDAIRGRVSAVHYVFIGMSNELGAAESGLAASLVGTVPAIVGGGAVALIVVGFVTAKWRALAAMPPLAELKADP